MVEVVAPASGEGDRRTGVASRTGAELELRLFGTIGASRLGTPVDVGAPKQRAVLAVLALECDRVVATDRLIDLLWDDDAPRATATLQTYISNLRRVLEPGRRPRDPATVLVSEAPGYRLAVDPDQIDVHRFARRVEAGRHLAQTDQPALAIAELEAALALATGPLVPELQGAPFVVDAASRLHRTHATALTLLAESHLALGDHLAALSRLEPAIAEHPLDEHLHAVVAIALYRAGRQTEALRVIDRVRRALGEGSGLELGPELRSLEADLLAQAPTLDWSGTAPLRQATPSTDPAPDVADPTAVAGIPLVGREVEFARLEVALDRAMAGRGGAVAVLGEPGIGKTRMLEELTAVARRRGAAVGWARCPESGAIPPFWPITEISTQLFAAGAIDATLVPPPDALDTGDASSPQTLFDLYQLVVATMREARQPILAVVDDLQWADVDSLRMLRDIAGQLAGTPVLLAVTARPLANDSHPALLDGLEALARTPDSLHIQLDGLSAEAVERWLCARTDVEVSPEVAGLVHARTSGHPLFVKELSELLVAEGTLHDVEAAEARRGIPPGVQFVVRRRVTRLPPETQQLLTVAAVVGRSFDLEVAAALCDLDPDRALDALDPALATGLVGADPGGGFRFSHALVAEALEAEVNHARAARLHARAARLLAERPGTEPALVAHHALAGMLAGSAELAASASVEAARAAETRLGFEDCALHWEHAVRALARARPGDRAGRIAALCELAAARFRIDRVSDASAAAVEALELAEVDGDTASMVRAASLLGHPHIWPNHSYGDVDARTAAALRRTAGRVGADQLAARALVLGSLAFELTYGPVDEWERVANEARDLARGCGDPEVLARVLLNTVGPLPPSQLDRRRRDGLDALALAAEHHLDPEVELISRFNLALVANELGELDDAVAEVARCQAIADRLGGTGSKAQLGWFQAQLELARGNYERALQLSSTAEQLYRRTRSHDVELISLILHVSMVGDRGGFAAMLDRFNAAAAESPAYSGATGQVLPWLAFENGWPDLARQLATAAGPAPELPDDYTTLCFGCLGLQVRSSLGLVDDVARLLPQVEPYAGRWSPAGSGPMVAGLVDLSLARGAECLGQLDLARRRYEVAVVGHERLRSPAWLARSLLHHGRFLLTHGASSERSDAIGRIERAGAIAAEHGLVPIAHQVEQALAER